MQQIHQRMLPRQRQLQRFLWKSAIYFTLEHIKLQTHANASLYDLIEMIYAIASCKQHPQGVLPPR